MGNKHAHLMLIHKNCTDLIQILRDPYNYFITHKKAVEKKGI